MCPGRYVAAEDYVLILHHVVMLPYILPTMPRHRRVDDCVPPPPPPPARLYKEVVDELLSEVAAEVLTAAAAADAFSMDMLVAAVAFSTGK